MGPSTDVTEMQEVGLTGSPPCRAERGHLPEREIGRQKERNVANKSAGEGNIGLLGYVTMARKYYATGISHLPFQSQYAPFSTLL